MGLIFLFFCSFFSSAAASLLPISASPFFSFTSFSSCSCISRASPTVSCGNGGGGGGGSGGESSGGADIEGSIENGGSGVRSVWCCTAVRKQVSTPYLASV